MLGLFDHIAISKKKVCVNVQWRIFSVLQK